MSRIATLLLTLIVVTPLAAQTPPAAPAPVVTPGTSTAPEPEGFAALKWGATVEQVNAVFPTAKCKTDRPRKDGTIYSRCELSSFAIGTINGSATIDLVNDSFHRVLFLFPSGQYDALKSLLMEKYGPTPRIETGSRREDAFAHALTSGKGPLATYQWTDLFWTWPDTEVDFMDNRLNGPYSANSNFTITRFSAEEKEARQKALKSF
jgi:hypothetical protein